MTYLCAYLATCVYMSAFIMAHHDGPAKKIRLETHGERMATAFVCAILGLSWPLFIAFVVVHALLTKVLR